MKKRIKIYVLAAVIIFIVKMNYDIRQTITYQMWHNAAYGKLLKEAVGIITCPYLFKDGSCTSLNAPGWTHPNEEGK